MKNLMVILAFAFCSCSDFLDQDHFEVDADLKYYTDKFFAEATNRGLDIRPNSLIVTLGNCSETDGVIGITKYKSITTVIIDKEFFESRKLIDSLMIETIVFHELGHAVLYRDHSDNYSLMNPNKYVSDYRLNKEKRIVLIDELLSGNHRSN